MTEKAKEFLKHMSEDEALRQKMTELSKEQDEETAKNILLTLAEEAGYSLSVEDFAIEQGEVNEAELDAVVGGWKQCVCPLGGYGAEDNDGHRCSCALFGSGYQKATRNASRSEVHRCYCFLGGYGDDFTG